MTDNSSASVGYHIDLPIKGDDYERPSAELIDAFEPVSAATAAALLNRMGIRRSFLRGPRPLRSGQRIVGTAHTLQFMPKREDLSIFGRQQEHTEKRTALWSVIEAAQPRDVLVVQAYGDLLTGVAGEMLTQALINRGGVGMVVDGCIRDTPKILTMDIGVWSVGSTPNYASQCDLFPWAYSVPVAVGGVLVLPGDIIIADDDGAVCVPLSYAQQLCEEAAAYEDKETFSRMRLAEGGDLRRYYPLSEEAQEEFAAWRESNSSVDGSR